MSKKQKMTVEERAKQKRIKNQIRKEKNRRVNTEVSSLLQLKRDYIISVLDEYNVDRITIKEVKDWISIPEVAPEFAQKLVKKSVELKKKREEKNIHLYEPTPIRKMSPDEIELSIMEDKMISDEIIQKLKVGKRLSNKQQDLIDEDGFYLAKDIVGRKPSEVVESYKDDEYAQLVAKYFKIDFNDHRTYPAHMGNCDMDGKEDSCEDRIQQQKEHVKEQRRLEAGMKEISIMTSDVQKGDYVKFYYDSKIGIVKKVNKVSYTVEGIGSSKDLGLLKNYRTNPEWLKKIDLSTYPSYEIDDEVMVHCLDGHKRFSKIVEKRNDCFYLIEYFVKSKNTNMDCWVDCSRFVE